MEKSTDDVLKEKPRSSKDSILNKQSIGQIGFEGNCHCNLYNVCLPYGY